jgi:NAD(P)-dependent dehydrogenase (short-subunit alcohol dehydrogenase family)
VNVISTFYLALLLLPKLKSSAKHLSTMPRLVIVSSLIHAYTQIPLCKVPSVFAALADEAHFIVKKGYAISKLLEVLIVREIAPKLEGEGVILNVMNPGVCHSNLNRSGS